jgi:hypothetical protein
MACLPYKGPFRKNLPWLGFLVTFPGHASTTIRLNYEAGYSFEIPHVGDPRRYWYADYRCGTGLCWKDMVKDTVFTIDGSDLGGTESFKGAPPQIPSDAPLITQNSVKYEIGYLEPEFSDGFSVILRRWPQHY